MLDLLKLEELKETVRGGGQRCGNRREFSQSALNGVQQKAAGLLFEPEAMAAGLVATTIEYDALQAKSPRTPGRGEGAFRTWTQSSSPTGAELRQFWRQTLYPELALKTRDANDAQVKPMPVAGCEFRLQNALRSLGPGVIGVRTLVGDDHTYVIVVTADGYAKHRGRDPQSGSSRRKVLAVREELRNHASRPQAHLQELYELLVAPIPRAT